ncbi:MAG: UDP-N-acetylmuramoyl-tripeptide--D-alanyl-D-alanine ligase [Deltaproteobacteria bacterium]
MEPCGISNIAEATCGKVVGGPLTAVFGGVSTDSRSVSAGDIFFALKGPNFDGHAFVAAVASKGASGAVVEKGFASSGLPSGFSVIAVDDTTAALGAFASWYRGRFTIPVVAISGSAGKTTTKEMAASILSRSRKVLKTEGNRNNLIGLPLTLLGLDRTHNAAVVELGISETWEMARLIGICDPTVALLTNIGRGHLGTLGNLEGVAIAKGPLFAGLEPGAIRAVNLDDEWVRRLAGSLKDDITYSLEKEADVRVVRWSVDGVEGVSATYDVRGADVNVRFSVPGASNVINGAAAIAAVLSLGVSFSDIEEGLGAYTPVKGRMSVVRCPPYTVIDDTYNANPESMASSLATLARVTGRRVAILGEMLELGDGSAEEHLRIGRLAADLGIDILVAVGRTSKEIADGALAGGLHSESIFTFADKKGALLALRDILREGDSVLVKGSRGVALEEVVEGIKRLGLGT